MIKFILLALVAVSLTMLPSAPVQAADYISSPVTIGTGSGDLTNTVAATTTNSSINCEIGVQKFKKASLHLRTKLAGAGTTGIDFTYVKSVDGTNYTTANTGSFTITPTGTITVDSIVSVDCTGLGKIKITTIANPNSAALTNLQFDVGYKQADN